MKKRLVAAIVVATTAAANAVPTITTPDGLYVWQGDVFIISNKGPANNPNLCAKMGNNVGKFAQAVFAPKGGPNGSNPDKLMLFLSGDFSAMYWVPNGNSGVLNNASSVLSSGIDQGGFYPSSTLNGTFSVSQPTPAPTAVGNSKVAVSFTITNQDPATKQNCTFTVAGTLTGPF